MTTAVAKEVAGLELIPLTALHESPWNPRKHFDPEALAELTESIKASGVLSPPLVRPRAKGGFEVAATSPPPQSLADTMTVADFVTELEREAEAIATIIRGVRGVVQRIEVRRTAEAPPVALPTTRKRLVAPKPQPTAPRRPRRTPAKKPAKKAGQKLNEKAIADIRRRRAAGEPASAVAKRYGVSSGRIYQVAPSKQGGSHSATSEKVRRRCEHCGQTGTADPCEHCFESRGAS